MQHSGGISWEWGLTVRGLLLETPGANIKEFLATFLSKLNRREISANALLLSVPERKLLERWGTHRG